jgi:hypothetical protein
VIQETGDKAYFGDSAWFGNIEEFNNSWQGLSMMAGQRAEFVSEILNTMDNNN